MVLDYRPHPAKGLLMQPFEAILLAGSAAMRPDAQIDAWLRAAEPAEHDKWEASERLTTLYKQGSGAALKKMWADVDRLIAELVSIQNAPSRIGADELSKLFPFGTPGSPDGTDDEFFLKDVFRRVAPDGSWQVSGYVESAVKHEGGWSARIRLTYAGERGRLAEVRIRSGRCKPGNITWNGGTANIVLSKPAPRRVAFTLETDSVSQQLGPTARRLAGLNLDATGEVTPNA
jgi:hypothetical protein